MTNDAIEVEGIVTATLWGWTYTVHIEDMWFEVRATVSWRMRKNKIRILPWDIVKVELSTYDPSKGRITYRSINKKLKKKTNE